MREKTNAAVKKLARGDEKEMGKNLPL